MNKRFKVHIKWFNYEKTEGEIELKDNGQPLLISESVEDVRYIQKLLNELHEENIKLKHELLCKQLNEAPTEPVNCYCYIEKAGEK